MDNLSLFEHEKELTRNERRERRAWIACLVTLIAFLVTNAAHIILYLR